MTNTTFADLLCSTVNSSHASVTFSGYTGTSRLVMPECFRDKGTNVTYIYASAFAVNTFSAFPSSTKTLRIVRSFLIGDGTGTGFSLDDGSLNWDQIWQTLPNLEALDFYESFFGGATKLPLLLPENVTRVNLTHVNGLSSTIPSSIFSLIMAGSRVDQVFDFQASGAELTGSIPASLFTGGSRRFKSFSFDVSIGHLNGTLPQSLLAPFANQQWSSFSLDLSSNSFNGTIPGAFYPFGFLAPSGTFSASFSLNPFTGLDSNFLENVHSFSSFEWKSVNSEIEGALPPRLFPGDWSKDPSTPGNFFFSIGGNELEGSIAPTFLTAGLTSNAIFTDFNIVFFANKLNGTIPETFLYRIDNTKRDSHLIGTQQDEIISSSTSSSSSASASTQTLFTITALSDYDIDFSVNDFTAPLPEAFFTHANLTSSAQSISLNLRSLELLEATIPEGLYQSIPNSGIGINIDFTFSTVFGSPPSTCWTSNSVTLDYSFTTLNGTIPTEWASCKFRKVSMTNIPTLTASLPPGFFNNMDFFYGYDTPFSGTLPTVSSNTSSFDISDTNIDVCSNPTAVAAMNKQSLCTMVRTNVCNCLSSFSRCSTDCTPSTASPKPSSVPSTSPIIRSPSSCPSNTRPSDDFNCIDGYWVAERVDSPSLDIPTNAGTILILEYLASTTITFGGLGSKINVSNPATNLSLINMELSDAQAKDIGDSNFYQILINIGADTNISAREFAELSLVQLNTKVSSGCRKAVAKKAVSNDGQTFGAYFTIDSSGCNRGWIIAVAVSVAVVVVIIVAIVVLAVVYKPFRECIRPHSKRRKASSSIS